MKDSITGALYLLDAALNIPIIELFEKAMCDSMSFLFVQNKTAKLGGLVELRIYEKLNSFLQMPVQNLLKGNL